ncbi:MAG: aspartyl protease family protein [Cyanobacteria bacterium HKST-UBA01]|nr:aspartyl protease family protein [Cyanobacteria bacterium HKST-UBA01]
MSWPDSKSKITILAAVFALTALPVQAASYNEAVSLYEKRDYEKALPLFQEAEKSGIQASRAAYYTALCYHQLRKAREAKAAYLHVVQRYPRTGVAQQALGILEKIDPAFARYKSEVLKRYEEEQNKQYQELPEVVKVKYRNVGGSGHMIVPAMINGVPIKMMFDTGAGVTCSKQSFLDRNRIKIENTKPSIRLRGVGGEVPTRVGLANITVGNMTRTIPLQIEQDQSTSKVPDGMGSIMQLPLLGQNYFKDFEYEIDDANKFLIFKKLASTQVASVASTKKSTVKSDLEVPFYRMGNHIIVTPKVNGRECEMILDTGAGTVAFADRHLAACGLNRPTHALSGQSGGVGGKRVGYNFLVDSIQLGPVLRKNVHCSMVLHSDFPKPLLGQTFLKGLKYTIDPSRNVIRFDESSKNAY